MFSGLTNQVSSWMGSVKGGETGEVPAGEGSTAADQQAPPTAAAAAAEEAFDQQSQQPQQPLADAEAAAEGAPPQEGDGEKQR